MQRGGVVVCWKACRSIDMEGGALDLGTQWQVMGRVFLQRRRSDTTQVRGWWRRETDLRPLDLKRRATSCSWVRQSFDLLRFTWHIGHQTSFVWGALPAH